MVWNPTSISVVSNTPVFTGVQGFENVKDTAFSDALKRIPADNMAAQLQLASRAIDGAYQQQINRDTIAYNTWATNQQNKQNRLRLAGLALAEAFAFGGGSSSQRNGTSASQKILDQLTVMNGLRNFGSAYNEPVAATTTAGLTRVTRQPG